MAKTLYVVVVPGPGPYSARIVGPYGSADSALRRAAELPGGYVYRLERDSETFAKPVGNRPPLTERAGSR